HTPDALRWRLHGTSNIPLPLGKNIDEALAVEREGHRPAYLWTVERGRVAVHDQVGTLVSRLQVTDCLWRLDLYIFHQWYGNPERERQIELAGNESKNRGRAVWNYHPLN